MTTEDLRNVAEGHIEYLTHEQLVSLLADLLQRVGEVTQHDNN